MPKKGSGHSEEAEVLREVRREAAARGDWKEVDEIEDEIVEMTRRANN